MAPARDTRSRGVDDPDAVAGTSGDDLRDGAGGNAVLCDGAPHDVLRAGQGGEVVVNVPEAQ